MRVQGDTGAERRTDHTSKSILPYNAEKIKVFAGVCQKTFARKERGAPRPPCPAAEFNTMRRPPALSPAKALTNACDMIIILTVRIITIPLRRDGRLGYSVIRGVKALKPSATVGCLGRVSTRAVKGNERPHGSPCDARRTLKAGRRERTAHREPNAYVANGRASRTFKRKQTTAGIRTSAENARREETWKDRSTTF